MVVFCVYPSTPICWQPLAVVANFPRVSTPILRRPGSWLCWAMHGSVDLPFLRLKSHFFDGWNPIIYDEIPEIAANSNSIVCGFWRNDEYDKPLEMDFQKEKDQEHSRSAVLWQKDIGSFSIRYCMLRCFTTHDFLHSRNPLIHRTAPVQILQTPQIVCTFHRNSNLPTNWNFPLIHFFIFTQL